MPPLSHSHRKAHNSNFNKKRALMLGLQKLWTSEGLSVPLMKVCRKMALLE